MTGDGLGYGGVAAIAVLISTVLAFRGLWRFLRDGRFGEAAIVLAIYLTPAGLLLWALRDGTAWLHSMVGPNVDYQIVYLSVAIAVSPAFVAWLVWLGVAGFWISDRDFSAKRMIAMHTTQASLRQKVGGLLFMVVGAALWIATAVFIPPSLARAPTTVLAIGSYLCGAILLLLPDPSRKPTD